DHAAAVAAAAELQLHHAFGVDFQQGDAAAVRGQPRIDLRLDHVAHALDHPGFQPRHVALDLRRADVQQAAGGVRLEIDAGAIQPRRTVALDMEVETGALDRPLVAEQLGRFAELQFAVRRWRTGRGHVQADAQSLAALLRQQAEEMLLRAFGNLDHASPVADIATAVPTPPSNQHHFSTVSCRPAGFDICARNFDAARLVFAFRWSAHEHP